jgi:hypothetical protein
MGNETRSPPMGNRAMKTIDDLEVHTLNWQSKQRLEADRGRFSRLAMKWKFDRDPLCGHRGTIVRFNGKQLFTTTVSLLRQSAFVEIEGHEVTPIGRPEIELAQRTPSGKYRVLDPARTSHRGSAFS